MGSYKISKANKCLRCGKAITYGRTDKKFCCEGCRNDYNNSIRRIHVVYKSRIDEAIRHNYSVLNNLVKMKVSSISLEEANALGLNTNYVTTYVKSGRRGICNCYDISFCVSESRIFNIHRLELYLQDNNNKK